MIHTLEMLLCLFWPLDTLNKVQWRKTFHFLNVFQDSSCWLIDVGEQLTVFDEESHHQAEQEKQEDHQDRHQSSADHQISSIVVGRRILVIWRRDTLHCSHHTSLCRLLANWRASQEAMIVFCPALREKERGQFIFQERPVRLCPPGTAPCWRLSHTSHTHWQSQHISTSTSIYF